MWRMSDGQVQSLKSPQVASPEGLLFWGCCLYHPQEILLGFGAAGGDPVASVPAMHRVYHSCQSYLASYSSPHCYSAQRPCPSSISTCSQKSISYPLHTMCCDPSSEALYFLIFVIDFLKLYNLDT